METKFIAFDASPASPMSTKVTFLGYYDSWIEAIDKCGDNIFAMSVIPQPDGQVHAEKLHEWLSDDHDKYYDELLGMY